MERLDGRAAVVTGAASGIGFAITEALARAGVRVLMTDIDGGALADAAARVTAGGRGRARRAGRRCGRPSGRSSRRAVRRAPHASP